MQHGQAKCGELQVSPVSRGCMAVQASSGQDACGAGGAGQVASSEKSSQVVGQRQKQAIYRREDRKGQEAHEEMSKLSSSNQRSPRYHFVMIRLARIEKPGTAKCWCWHGQRGPPVPCVGMAAGGANQDSHLPGLMQTKSHLPQPPGHSNSAPGYLPKTGSSRSLRRHLMCKEAPCSAIWGSGLCRMDAHHSRVGGHVLSTCYLLDTVWRT